MSTYNEGDIGDREDGEHFRDGGRDKVDISGTHAKGGQDDASIDDNLHKVDGEPPTTHGPVVEHL